MMSRVVVLWTVQWWIVEVEMGDTEEELGVGGVQGGLHERCGCCRSAIGGWR